MNVVVLYATLPPAVSGLSRNASCLIRGSSPPSSPSARRYRDRRAVRPSGGCDSPRDARPRLGERHVRQELTDPPKELGADPRRVHVDTKLTEGVVRVGVG